MADIATKQTRDVPEVGMEIAWSSSWGGGRGIYLGENKIFSYETGNTLDISSATAIERTNRATAANPVVILNGPGFKLRTIFFGVLLANLATAVVAAVLYAMTR